MALTPGDKAECKEIAREIVKEVLMEHIQACPHGRSLLIAKWTLVGACFASALGGGTFATIAMRVLSHI